VHQKHSVYATFQNARDGVIGGTAGRMAALGNQGFFKQFPALHPAIRETRKARPECRDIDRTALLKINTILQ
jgi:hypothetical protein